MTNAGVIVLVGVLVLIVVILLLPFIFKNRKRLSFKGPDLSELQYTEVFFNNGDISLAGLLFLPDGEGPFPTAVIIHGSGTSRRNNRWYLTVVHHLQKNGIAVLLPDKRGSEKSGGNWKQANFYDFAGDASSAIDFIKSQTIFKHSYVGVLGHSQGGWIAPLTATQDKDVAFVVCWSGPGVTVDEQILYQTITDITNAGIYRFLAKLIAPFVAKRIMKMENCRMIVGFDPIPCWKQVTVPSFMAFGEGDPNLPVEESVSKIKTLGKSNVTIKVYPKGEHGITEFESPGVLRIQEKLLGDLVDFIKNKEDIQRGEKQ